MPKRDYRIHTFRFSLQSDDPVDPQLLDQIFPTSVQAPDAPVRDHSASGAAHRFGIERAEGEIILSLDDRSIFRSPSAEEAYSELEWTITNTALDELDQYLQLHAGGIAVNNDALLIVAEHGLGKTSLVTAMMLAGGSPLSDDIILIDPDSQTLRSFPRAFKMSAFHTEALPEILEHLERVDFAKVEHARTNPEGLAEVRFAREADCKFIVFLEEDRRDPPELIPIGQTEAFGRLLQATLNFRSHGQAGVEAISKLIERASCFVLHAGPLRPSSRLLYDLLTRGD